MKKFLFFLFIAIAIVTVHGKTLRVNNTPGNGAPYTTFSAALEDANTGDVIILEPSTTSYGDLTINKSVTVKGVGYFLDVNTNDKEGLLNAQASKVNIKAPNVTVSNLEINTINVSSSAPKAVITRCYFWWFYFQPKDNETCENCIIHQNFISGNISTSSYPQFLTSNVQITNNIFTYNDASSNRISGVTNSVISRNSIFTQQTYPIHPTNVKGSVIEYNICKNITNSSSSNSFNGNVDNTGVYDNNSAKNDKLMMEAELQLNVDAGAFSGSDPYVLSGLPSGPRVTDLEVPVSVEKGEDLRVTVKIGSSR